MWSEESYLEYAKARIESFKANNPTSSDPKLLFKYVEHEEEYIFDEDNWNGYDLLRKFLLTKLYDNGVKLDVTIGNTHVTADCCYDMDDWRGYILLERSTNIYDLYTLSWYKHRGKTESIKKNETPITLTDYVMLLNLLGVEEE